MIKRGLVSRWFVLLVGILVAILAVTTSALVVAAHQEDSDTYDSDWIHACRQNNNGQLKYVGPDGTCGNNETPIHWPATQTGGPPGPSGSTLVAGTPAISDPFSSEKVVNRGTLITANATCPNGTVLLGGGAEVTTSPEGSDWGCPSSHPTRPRRLNGQPPRSLSIRSIASGPQPCRPLPCVACRTRLNTFAQGVGAMRSAAPSFGAGSQTAFGPVCLSKRFLIAVT
jgi:hypothetical protein